MSRERGRDRYDERDFAHKGVSLLVRNLSYRTRAEDLKRVFSKYGDVRDVYIPLHFHTKEPRGFAFVEFFDPKDARDAQEDLDRYDLDGRQLTVVYAQEQRKRPDDMRHIDGGPARPSGRRDDSRDRDRGRRAASSRSPPPRRGGGRSRSRSRERRYSRERGGGGGGGNARRGRSNSRSPPPKRREHRDSMSPPPARRSSYSPPPPRGGGGGGGGGGDVQWGGSPLPLPPPPAQHMGRSPEDSPARGSPARGPVLTAEDAAYHPGF